jgi:hypothetical protein
MAHLHAQNRGHHWPLLSTDLKDGFGHQRTVLPDAVSTVTPMNILFVCTSLEPGRDGVGDYARLLAEACIDAGHSCALLAVNDGFVTHSHIQIQCDRHYELECFRLTSKEPWSTRLQHAIAFVQKCNPDWVSWQIVPYGFGPKGVIPSEANAMRVLGRGRRVHVMLHELWIGLAKGEPFKNRFWGWFQQRGLRSFVSALQPALIHTTNAIYQTVLTRDEGWHAELLPLFGNIPITELVPPKAEPDKWIGGIFGTVHPQFDPHPCMDILIEGARASRRTVRMLGIGRLGPHGEALFHDLENEFRGIAEFVIVGERSPPEISRLLQSIDFGVATHPWALLGKSGVVAALIDHGLPGVDWVLRGAPVTVPAIDPMVVKLSDMPPELMAGRVARKRTAAPSLPAIAEVFLSSLGLVAASHSAS